MTKAPDPIVKTLTVPLPPDRAFALFTDRMSEWWPLDTHSLSGQAGAAARAVEVPRKVGAQVVEVTPAGDRLPWGRVTEYAPGAAFAMTWHVGRAEENASHLRVTFDATPGGTLVRLVHDNWQALGAEATALRQGYDSGWNGVLCTCYARAAGVMAAA